MNHDTFAIIVSPVLGSSRIIEQFRRESVYAVAGAKVIDVTLAATFACVTWTDQLYADDAQFDDVSHALQPQVYVPVETVLNVNSVLFTVPVMLPLVTFCMKLPFRLCHNVMFCRPTASVALQLNVHVLELFDVALNGDIRFTTGAVVSGVTTQPVAL